MPGRMPRSSGSHHNPIVSTGEEFVPVDLSGTGYATIVLRDMDVDRLGAHDAMAFAWLFSSMWAWKLSYIILQ